MKVFTLLGLSGSGKTSTIECLIKELNKRGYSVGTIKEIHFEKFRMDTEGKNTYRHREAGADTVTARGIYETDILYKGHLPIYDILSHYNEDYVIMEGVRDAVVPEIVVCAESDTPKVSDLTFAVSGRYSLNGDRDFNGVPVINALTDIEKLTDLVEKVVPDLMYDIDTKCCSACGADCRSLLAKIIKGEEKRSSCVIGQGKINLKVNGNRIVIVPFVENLLKNVVLGVVKELKGYQPNAKVEIEIN